MAELGLEIKLPKIKIKDTKWHWFTFVLGKRILNKKCVSIYINNELVKSFTYGELMNKELSTGNEIVIDDESKVLNDFLDSDYFRDKLIIS